MAFERLIKRTVWESKCSCGDVSLREDNAPRSRHCKCGKWADYEEKSVVGPDLNLPGYK